MKMSVPRNSALDAQAGSRGFSLVEVLATVAIIGILSAVAIGTFHNVRDGAKLGVAREVVNDLNQAVADYSQVKWEIDVAATDGDAAEETWILHSLQYRDAVNPEPGAPFMNPTWIPVVSDDLEDYRIQWNGRVFELVLPGTAATGFRVNFESGSDLGTVVSFPAGFTQVSPGYHASAP